MKKETILKVIMWITIALIIMIGGTILWPTDRGAIVVAAEPIFGPLTNALFTSFLLTLVIMALTLWVSNNLKESPGHFQNLVEVMFEFLEGMVNDTAPKKWAATFFPIVATIFIYLLFTNWFSLFTPMWASFGLICSTERGIPIEHVTFFKGSGATVPVCEHGAKAEAHAKESFPEAETKVMVVPIFRAPSSDLNLTVALALIAVVLTQFFGIQEKGLGYFKNFLRFDSFAKQGPLMGFIDFAVGLLEGLSEFTKIISFSFRLFGNIFAGEVILIIISSLVSFLLVVVFLGFEVFVGFIQAFIFFILTLIFFSMATQHHGEEQH